MSGLKHGFVSTINSLCLSIFKEFIYHIPVYCVKDSEFF